MARLLFEKKGDAVWISHLDLMRLFQRAFKRAGLSLTHSHGFNPRASVSIALPLSVGVESSCELLDFELEAADVSDDTLRDKLNSALPAGVQVLQVYDDGRKLRELSLLDCLITLEYDAGIPVDALPQIRALFERSELLVSKKSKSGQEKEQNITEMIRRCNVTQADDQTIQLQAQICCQNPTLNPMQLTAAIEKYLPQYRPDHAKCARLEIYDGNERVFR